MSVALHVWVSLHHFIVFLLHKFKMMTSPDTFFIFSKFCFSGLLGGRGLKGQKMAQNDKKLCFTPYLRNCTSYDCGFWYRYVKWWYLQQFFSFFQKSDFSGFSKFINKGQKEILEVCPTFFKCVWFFLLRMTFISLKFSKQFSFVSIFLLRWINSNLFELIHL